MSLIRKEKYSYGKPTTPPPGGELVNKIIIGVDPSLRSTGICLMKVDDYNDFKTHVIIPGIKLKGLQRLEYIRHNIAVLVGKFVNSDYEIIVGIEDYAYSRFGRTFALGELGGVIKLYFYKLGIREYNIRPVNIMKWKKEVIGKGNAKKEEIAYYVKNILGQEFKTQDECDSFCIAEYIRRQL